MPAAPLRKSFRILQGQATKAGLLLTLTQDEIKGLEMDGGSPFNYLTVAWKIEKYKYRPLIGMFLPCYVQMSSFAHVLEEVLTEYIPMLHMEGSPSRVLAMCLNAVERLRQTPECEVFMADCKASDSQPVDRQVEFMRFVMRLADHTSLSLSAEDRDHFMAQMHNYQSHCDNLTLMYTFLTCSVFFRQYYGVITGSPLTKLNNTVVIGSHFELGKRLLEVVNVLGRMQGSKFQVDCLDVVFVQGDDMFALVGSGRSRFMLLKVLELLNVRLKIQASPGPKGRGNYLQTWIGVGGICKILARGMQASAREPALVELTISQQILLNLANAQSMCMRGAGDSFYYRAAQMVADQWFGSPNDWYFLALDSDSGGLGFLYYGRDGLFVKDIVSHAHYAEVVPQPTVLLSDAREKFVNATRLLDFENDMYKSIGLTVPVERIRAVYAMAARTWRFQVRVSNREKKQVLGQYLSQLKKAPPTQLLDDARLHAFLRDRLYIWDEAIAELKEGRRVDFKAQVPLLRLNSLVEPPFIDFSSFHAFVTAGCQKEHGKRAVGRDEFLAFAKKYMRPSSFDVLREILHVTAVFNGGSRFLEAVARQSAAAEVRSFAKKQFHKVSTMADLRSFLGCGGNVIHPSVNELMRNFLTSFAQAQTWAYFSNQVNEQSAQYWSAMAKDVTRPIRYYKMVVREVLVLMQEWRQKDIHIEGEKRFSVRVGALRPDFDLNSLLFNGVDFEKIGVKSGDPAQSLAVTVPRIRYVGVQQPLKNEVGPVDLVFRGHGPRRSNRMTDQVNRWEFQNRFGIPIMEKRC